MGRLNGERTGDPLPGRTRAGFDAAYLPLVVLEAAGVPARPLFRRAEEDPSALPRRILPVRRGAEARRFNRFRKSRCRNCFRSAGNQKVANSAFKWIGKLKRRFRSDEKQRKKDEKTAQHKAERGVVRSFTG
jgi:hypothetical protein